MKNCAFWNGQNFSTLKTKLATAGYAASLAWGLGPAGPPDWLRQPSASPPRWHRCLVAAEGDALDLVNDFDGALQGGATASAVGVSGTAFQFNGATAYVSVPNSPALNLSNLTVECWVRFDSLDSTGSGGSPPGSSIWSSRRTPGQQS
jgi:hypothetical protein